MEIWKDIKNYENLYQISNMGNVKSLHYGKERILKTSHDKRGYPIVDLRKNGCRWTVHVHRLVANAFICNLAKKSTVNHKNEIKTDNRVENLEWFTNTENINYGSRNQKVAELLKKKILMLDLNNNIINEFSSITEAVKQGYNNTGISLCCNHKRKTHRNYKWKFKTE